MMMMQDMSLNYILILSQPVSALTMVLNREGKVVHA
jgi:hypothetical protein